MNMAYTSSTWTSLFRGQVSPCPWQASELGTGRATGKSPKNAHAKILDAVTASCGVKLIVTVVFPPRLRTQGSSSHGLTSMAFISPFSGVVFGAVHFPCLIDLEETVATASKNATKKAAAFIWLLVRSTVEFKIGGVVLITVHRSSFSTLRIMYFVTSSHATHNKFRLYIIGL